MKKQILTTFLIVCVIVTFSFGTVFADTSVTTSGITQTTYTSVDEAKQSAINTLNSTVNLTDYALTQQLSIKTIIATGTQKINAETTIPGVFIVLKDYVSQLQAVKSISTLSLDEVKLNAKAFLVEYANIMEKLNIFSATDIASMKTSVTAAVGDMSDTKTIKSGTIFNATTTSAIETISKTVLDGIDKVAVQKTTTPEAVTSARTNALKVLEDANKTASKAPCSIAIQTQIVNEYSRGVSLVNAEEDITIIPKIAVVYAERLLNLSSTTLISEAELKAEDEVINDITKRASSDYQEADWYKLVDLEKQAIAVLDASTTASPSSIKLNTSGEWDEVSGTSVLVVNTVDNINKFVEAYKKATALVKPTVGSNKTVAISTIETEFASYPSANYSLANWDKLVSTKNTYVTTVTNASDNEAVNTAVKNAKKEMYAVEQIADTDSTFTALKTSCISELRTFASTLTKTYKEAQTNEINTIVTEAVANINASHNSFGKTPNEYVTEAKTLINAIKDATEIDAYLVTQRATASDVVANYKNITNYNISEKTAINNAQNTAYASIAVSMSDTEINKAVATYKATVDNLKTSLQISAADETALARKTDSLIASIGVVDAKSENKIKSAMDSLVNYQKNFLGVTASAISTTSGITTVTKPIVDGTKDGLVKHVATLKLAMETLDTFKTSTQAYVTNFENTAKTFISNKANYRANEVSTMTKIINDTQALIISRTSAKEAELDYLMGVAQLNKLKTTAQISLLDEVKTRALKLFTPATGTYSESQQLKVNELLAEIKNATTAEGVRNAIVKVRATLPTISKTNTEAIEKAKAQKVTIASMYKAYPSKKVYLTWEAQPGVSGYIVSMNKGGNKYEHDLASTQTSYTFAKTTHTEYYATVTPYTTVDGEKVLGVTSKITSFTASKNVKAKITKVYKAKKYVRVTFANTFKNERYKIQIRTNGKTYTRYYKAKFNSSTSPKYLTYRLNVKTGKSCKVTVSPYTYVNGVKVFGQKATYTK